MSDIWTPWQGKILDRTVEDVNPDTPGTSFHDVWPPGFPWPSGSQCVRCLRRETRGTDPRRLEGLGPWWALERNREGGMMYNTGSKKNKKQG